MTAERDRLCDELKPLNQDRRRAAREKAAGRELDGQTWDEFPTLPRGIAGGVA